MTQLNGVAFWVNVNLFEDVCHWGWALRFQMLKPGPDEAQESDLKSDPLKMIEAFKDQMNKCLKEIQDITDG